MMYGTGFWDIMRELTDNPAGRGIFLVAATFPVAWVQYALGEMLKTYAPVFIRPRIPKVLGGFAFIVTAAIFGPLKNIMPGLELSEVMLVLGTGTVGAVNIHSREKIKKLKNGGGK
jgi:hypothetical protein